MPEALQSQPPFPTEDGTIAALLAAQAGALSQAVAIAAPGAADLRRLVAAGAGRGRPATPLGYRPAEPRGSRRARWARGRGGLAGSVGLRYERAA